VKNTTIVRGKIIANRIYCSPMFSISISINMLFAL